MNLENCQLRSFKIKFVFVVVFLFVGPACSLVQKTSSKSKREVRDINLLSVNHREDNGPRKRLVILPFLDKDLTRPQSLRDRSRQSFIYELNRSGQYIVMEGEELKLDLFSFIKNGEYDFKELAKKASTMGISGFLEGKIMDLHIKRDADNIGLVRQLKSVYEAGVRVRIATARVGNEVFNTEKTVVLEDKGTRVAERTENDKVIENNLGLIEAIVRDAFLEFLPQIDGAMAKIIWEGRIAALSGDRIYVNVGQVSGVQIGDILKISDEGEEVFDPEHGSFIGKVPGRVKGTIEVISYFGTDAAIAIIHSGSGFKENDRVEIY